MFFFPALLSFIEEYAFCWCGSWRNSSEIRSGARRERPWMSFSLNVDGGFMTVRVCFCFCLSDVVWAGNPEVMDAILDLQLVEGMSVVCQGEVKLSRRRNQDGLFNTYVSMSAVQLRRGVQWQVELEGDSGRVDSNPATNERVLKRLRHAEIVPRELTEEEKARIDTMTAAATVETFDEFGCVGAARAALNLVEALGRKVLEPESIKQEDIQRAIGHLVPRGKEQQFFDSFMLSLEYNSNKNNNNNDNDYNDYNAYSNDDDDNNDDNDNDNDDDNDNNDNNDNNDDNDNNKHKKNKSKNKNKNKN
ncbi:hypothetical protein BDB00DRAFT_155882 [Zychaea mexicana]|uniref:uncharacterized protein n=1 Tax=Zychaea mexicana TaxID=64656 RepID=UPI0022FE302D|nr:uncharacterized protein BDB00DRAFT_155882 [Zychaea mexicana]KAI9484275.1 hypothetical protein BDB00DRAFT_155882 [Zychaea mexicana]